MGKKEIRQIIVLVCVIIAFFIGVMIFIKETYFVKAAIPIFTGENLLSGEGEYVYPYVPWGADVSEAFVRLETKRTEPVAESFVKSETAQRSAYILEPITRIVITDTYVGSNVKRSYGCDAAVQLEFCNDDFCGVYYTAHYLPRIPTENDGLLDLNPEFTLENIGVFYANIRFALSKIYGEPTYSQGRRAAEEEGVYTRSDEWRSASGKSRITLVCIEGEAEGTVTVGIDLPDGKIE